MNEFNTDSSLIYYLVATALEAWSQIRKIHVWLPEVLFSNICAIYEWIQPSHI